MKLPIFAVVGARLVRVLQTSDGGMSVQVLDPKSGEFVRDRSYLEKVTFTNNDTDFVSQEQFEEMVAAARERRAKRLAEDTEKK